MFSSMLRRRLANRVVPRLLTAVDESPICPPAFRPFPFRDKFVSEWGGATSESEDVTPN